MVFRDRKHPRPTVDASSVWAAPATGLARRTATLFGRPRCQPTRYISACVTAIGRTSTGIIILYHSTAADRHDPRTTTSKSPGIDSKSGKKYFFYVFRRPNTRSFRIIFILHRPNSRVRDNLKTRDGFCFTEARPPSSKRMQNILEPHFFLNRAVGNRLCILKGARNIYLRDTAAIRKTN